ncbi:riboflavin kinase/fmn adenylyltransferase-like protein [Leishmania panamensis]|uniref:riboflavin kinase n=1 Tax=Leishmania panamensis TaxID=5679 RepID=A0A088SJC7_LEIPA|nr:riboflavin kinase/fmn adenylyltransferase-like protein [Leishmania panamensis]AIO01927.1 riboflavin kinase/fmn adenylyltransferase-like protein [Leishmania panamensis]
MKPWFLRGKVIHGFGRGGTQLGYPTANLELSEPAIDFLKPYDNFVFWGWGCVEAAVPSTEEPRNGDLSLAPLGPFPFVMSVGNNPQFKNVDVSAEVHFLHKFDGDFYGRVVRILTLEAIRSQSAFTTLEELIKSIDDDVMFAGEHLKMPEWAPYEQHDMVNPACVPAQLNSAPQLPSFGFLEL